MKYYRGLYNLYDKDVQITKWGAAMAENMEEAKIKLADKLEHLGYGRPTPCKFEELKGAEE